MPKAIRLTVPGSGTAPPDQTAHIQRPNNSDAYWRVQSNFLICKLKAEVEDHLKFRAGFIKSLAISLFSTMKSREIG